MGKSVYHGENTGVLIQGIVVVHGGNHEVHPSSLDVLDSLLVESRLGKMRGGTETVEVTVSKMVIGSAEVTVTKTVVGMTAGHVSQLNGALESVGTTIGIEVLLPLSLTGSSRELDGKPGNGPTGGGTENTPNGEGMRVVKPLGRVDVKVVDNIPPPYAPVAWLWEIVVVNVNPLVSVVISVVEGSPDEEPGGP